MDIDSVVKAIAECNSINEVLEFLGFKKNNSTQRFKLLNVIRSHQINIDHFGTEKKIPTSSRWKDVTTVKCAAEQASNLGEFLSILGLSSKGSNRDTAKMHISRLGIDTTHWDKHRVNGLEDYRTISAISLDEILNGQHPTYKTYLLKNRLIKEGIKQNSCEMCGITEWNAKPLAIHLDHVNGISTDHRLENLRMLCPNCHSQTDTYAGKNRTIV